MPKPARLLLVDPEQSTRDMLAAALRSAGYLVQTAVDALQALPALREFSPEVVVTDLQLPGLDGLAVLRAALAQNADCAVVLLAPVSALDTAVAALRTGAADYVCKPTDPSELALSIERALEHRRLRQTAAELRSSVGERSRLSSLHGSSPAIGAIFDTVLRVAQSPAPVLITGESGTGKDVVAAAIHEHSPRSGRPFVKVSCAALTHQLLASELFGHERGAFPGALSRRDGSLQQADGGTLFLDEVGELPAELQARLLRFLEVPSFERIGGTQTVRADVRIIAATRVTLHERIARGLFREDLYYRLSVISLTLPPLRQRPSDLEPMAQHFLRKLAARSSARPITLSQAALDKLKRYPWPGNVRELETVLEQAVLTCRGDTLGPEDLAISVTTPASRPLTLDTPTVPGATLADLERFAILKTLEHTGGSPSKAARILGVSRRKIQYRMHEYYGGPLLKRAGASHK